MRLSYRLAGVALVLAALMLAACNSNDPKGNRAVVPAAPSDSSAHIAPADGVKRVTTVEVRDALANGTAVVYDVRPAEAYQQNHIKGSISLPLQDIEKRLGEFPRDKMIITYCS